MGMRTESKKKITKTEFYTGGGFSNPDLFRVTRGRSWTYYRIIKNY